MIKAPFGKCDICSLKNNIFVPSEIHKSKICALAEAPGYHESIEGRPLVGVAGQDLNDIVTSLGYKREDITYVNSVACLTNPRVSIFTSKGWVIWQRLSIGDLVLTHNGNFKRVKNKIKFEREKDTPYFVDTEAGRVWVSSDHRFNTEQGWKFVNELIDGDKIQVLGNKCTCGKIYFSNNKFCSPKCEKDDRSERTIERNRRGQLPESREKIRQSMLNQYQSGIRDAQEITKKAHEVYKIQGATGLGELDLKELLTKWGFTNKHHAPIEKWQVDFLLDDKIIIEIWTGGLSDWQEIEDKRKYLEPLGYKVLDYHFSIVYRYPDLIKMELKNIKKNHSKEFSFQFIPIIKIRKSNRVHYKQMLYSLEIEDDESFVARRLVHHNCRPTKIEDGKTFNRTPTDEEIALCNERLIAELEKLSPIVIVCMGKVPYIALGGSKAVTMNQVVGTKFVWRDRFDVVVTYHPAAISHAGGVTSARGKMIKGNIEDAFKVAFAIKPRPKQLRMF